MERGIIHDHHDVLGEDGAKLLFQPGIEHRCIACSLEQAGGDNFPLVPSGQEAGAGPGVAGSEAVDALAAHGITVCALGAVRKATFIQIQKRFAAPPVAFS